MASNDTVQDDFAEWDREQITRCALSGKSYATYRRPDLTVVANRDG